MRACVRSPRYSSTAPSVVRRRRHVSETWSSSQAAIEQPSRRSAWVFEAVGRSWHYVGEFGVGSKMKFIANLLIAVHNLAAAEALLLAKSTGLDPNLVHEVISDSAATSRMFEVSGRIMVDGEYADGEAKVEILHKDLQIIRSFASDARSPAPLVGRHYGVLYIRDGARYALDGGCLGHPRYSSDWRARPITTADPADEVADCVHRPLSMNCRSG